MVEEKVKLNLKKDFNASVDDNSIILICVVRDEFLLLDYFIKHYIEIGITHFIFVDNDSTDGTLDYLVAREDIECMVYHTADSYAKNEYGISWVNEILNNYCKNMWCLVVDVDELLMPRGGMSLGDIRDDMEKNDSNVMVTCLIDFYPKRFDEFKYVRGNNFLDHSNYYERLIKKDTLVYIAEDNSLVIKGGLRQRTLGSEQEPVCLTKKSFFKFDWFGTHSLAVGMHWILPKDFISENYSTWKEYEGWFTANKNIRFHAGLLVVAHFKFIKSNIFDYFKERVRKNQDWDNSIEYRKYSERKTDTFYDEVFSVKYTSGDEVYKDTIDLVDKKMGRLIGKRFVIVISEQRHGSTTLCLKIDNLYNTVSVYEAFNSNGGRFYAPSCENLENHISKVMNEKSWIGENKYISFKIFRDHAISLDDIFQLNVPKKVIFLKRDLKNSYASWKSALLTGNWGTTPRSQASGQGFTGHSKLPHEIMEYFEYEEELNAWFSLAMTKVEEYNISHETIWFSDVINNRIDIERLVKK